MNKKKQDVKIDFVAISDQLSNQKRKVDYDPFDWSIREVLTMLEEGEINIAPHYQRKFRWSTDVQSRLIESIYLGIPIPTIFLAENADRTYEVIDGVQRLSTIAMYAGSEKLKEKLKLEEKPSLKLGELEFLTTLDKTTFSSLTETVQRQFKQRGLKITVLTDRSDKAVRLDLFRRLNTGGVKLTDQELRKMIFSAETYETLEELTKDSNFQKLIHFKSNKQDDGSAEEWVLRFFAYLFWLDKYKRNVREFLDDFSINFDFKSNRKMMIDIFKQTMNSLFGLMPEGIKDKKGSNQTPVAVYEGLTIGLARAITEKRVKIDMNTSGEIQKMLLSKEFLDSTGDGSNATGKIKKRIEMSYKIFI